MTGMLGRKNMKSQKNNRVKKGTREDVEREGQRPINNCSIKSCNP